LAGAGFEAAGFEAAGFEAAGLDAAGLDAAGFGAAGVADFADAGFAFGLGLGLGRSDAVLAAGGRFAAAALGFAEAFFREVVLVCAIAAPHTL
jgi:hypothetical protein